MRIKLKKKIDKRPVIICGFPSIGLIGTIVTEFLIEHTNADFIGHFEYDEFTPTATVHKGKLIHPMGVFYDKKYNIIILHTILNPMGLEWKIAKSIFEFAKTVKATQILSIEGVMAAGETKEKEPNLYYYTTNDVKAKRLDHMKLKKLQESIIVGVTSALLLKATDEDLTCLFAQTASALPDSNSAAKVIQTLDKYLDLSVDYKPLLKQAQVFEDKLKKMLSGAGAPPAIPGEETTKQQMSYVG
ncbi:proteasome assembly chaperone family protein [Candidatus Woesearchaeota archaeon]|nr:proteasome assembly chaperone family protein [Candidatus Woesearchaeota archaeon]